MSRLLAIDPGSTVSGWVILDHRHWITGHGISPNEEVLAMVQDWPFEVAIEKIQSYSMAVGQTIFDTCEWSGRMVQAYHDPSGVIRVTRPAVKLHLCHSTMAKDSNVNTRLLDLWGPKGTKHSPGPTYGMAKDMWAALGVAATVRGIEFPLDWDGSLTASGILA